MTATRALNVLDVSQCESCHPESFERAKNFWKGIFSTIKKITEVPKRKKLKRIKKEIINE
jgi:hypothetical protein